jgi:hypothetical protein
MSVCRGARDLTFQYPCSYRFPPRAGGTQQRFPLRSRGNLTEGVFKKCRAMSVHGGGLGWGQWGAKKEDAPRKGRAHLAHFGSGGSDRRHPTLPDRNGDLRLAATAQT